MATHSSEEQRAYIRIETARGNQWLKSMKHYVKYVVSVLSHIAQLLSGQDNFEWEWNLIKMLHVQNDLKL